MSKGAWTLASLAPRGSKGLEGADAGARSLALARVQASVRAKYHGADSPSPTHQREGHLGSPSLGTALGQVEFFRGVLVI